MKKKIKTIISVLLSVFVVLLLGVNILSLTTRGNKMVNIRTYQRTFERILKKLNINVKNFHSLRHTFATRAIEMGIDVKTVSEILGHNSPMITLNKYSHSLMSYKTEMMAKMGKMLDKK